MPSISKYCVVWVDGASGSASNEYTSTSPSIGCLLHGVDESRRFDADRLEDGRHDVGDVVVLVAELALGLDPVRPVHDERVPHTAEVRVLLAQLERRVPGERPADRVVVVRTGLAELVDARQVPLHRLGRFAGEDRDALLVEHTVERPLAGRAVVADEHEEQRVVELAGLLEEVDDPADLRVGVLHVAGVHLGHAREQPLLVGRTASSHFCTPSSIGDSSAAVGHDAHLLLPRQHLLAVRVPAHVELALVPVGPLRPDVMRRVASPRTPDTPATASRGASDWCCAIQLIVRSARSSDRW